MWCDNSTTNSYGYNRDCKCYNTPYCQSVTVPNLCTVCHANLYASATPWYNNNVLPDNQLAPQYPISNVRHPIFHVQNNQQMHEQNYLSLQQNNGCLNHIPWAGNQYTGQFNQMQQLQSNYDGNYGMLPDQILKFSQHDFSRAPFNSNSASLVNGTLCQKCPKSNNLSLWSAYVFPFGACKRRKVFRVSVSHEHITWHKVDEASLPPTGASNGSFSNIMDFPREWGPNHFSFQPGNLLEETVGSRSNSASISSEVTQKLVSLDESKKPFEHPPMSRQDRVLRYFEKKKTRKYDKKIQFSLRKAYARTRPRVRGRFTSSSQKDTTTTVE